MGHRGLSDAHGAVNRRARACAAQRRRSLVGVSELGVDHIVVAALWPCVRAARAARRRICTRRGAAAAIDCLLATEEQAQSEALRFQQKRLYSRVK